MGLHPVRGDAVAGADQPLAAVGVVGELGDGIYAPAHFDGLQRRLDGLSGPISPLRIIQELQVGRDKPPLPAADTHSVGGFLRY